MVRTQHVMVAVICTAVLTALTDPQARSQEKRIPRSEVPQAVLSAFAKSYPNAKIRGTAWEREGALTYYEIESKDGSVMRDLLYTKDGALSESEETIPVSTLPEVVRSTLSKEIAKATVTRAEKVTRRDAVSYEIHLAQGGTRGSILIDPSGKVLKKRLPGGKSQKHSGGEEENEND